TERQLDRRDDERAAREPAPRQEIRRRGADGEDQRLRDRGRLQADEQRVAGDRVAELPEQVARRDAQEDRDDGQEQERERERGREDERDAERPPHGFFGRPNPAAASATRPVFASTFLTNACAAVWFGLAFTTAISYFTFGCAHPGSRTTLTLSATGFASVT